MSPKHSPCRVPAFKLSSFVNDKDFDIQNEDLLETRCDRTTSETYFSSDLPSNVDCITNAYQIHINDPSQEISEPETYLEDCGIKDTDAVSGGVCLLRKKSNDLTKEDE